MPSSLGFRPSRAIKYIVTSGPGATFQRPTYCICAGNTLDTIARGVSAGLVPYQGHRCASNISNPNKIAVAQELWIPVPGWTSFPMVTASSRKDASKRRRASFPMSAAGTSGGFPRWSRCRKGVGGAQAGFGFSKC
ncbi:hypothetical protein OsJ_23753 [Oryza sativa Japonica Group]|uniref:Uncharacterized protein n=1 Tax=Oryza sativa subsp. japonica TaxID=39947 RepID=B9FWH1_ORYSJ|nr:hypothetical protein OsJ_23753 [Oryza sativa Japonica Group]